MSPTSSELMDDFETALRDALHEEAATASAAPDALARIRIRIDRPGSDPGRRSHSFWFGAGGAIVATAAVAAAAAAGVLAFTGASPHSHTGTGTGRPGPGTSPASGGGHSAGPSPTSSTPSSTPSQGLRSGKALSYVAIAHSKLVDVSGPTHHVLRLSGAASQASQLSDLSSSPTGGVLHAIQGAGSCGAQLVKVGSGAGHPVTSDVAPPAGYSVTGYALDGSRVAAVETACDGSGGRLVASDSATGSDHTVTWQGNPPAVVGNPAWAGPQALDVVWRTGTEATPVQLNPFTADRIDTGAPACGNFDSATYLPENLQGSGSDVFVVAQAAGGTTVLTCDPSVGPQVAFHVPRAAAATAATLRGNGHWRVLLADSQGKLWLWPGSAGSKAHVVRTAPKGITAIG